MNPGISQVDLETIAGKCPDHPNVACRMFFEVIHGEGSYEETGVTHPNEYFTKSEELFIKNEN